MRMSFSRISFSEVLRKIMIIIIGSVVAAYGMCLAIHAGYGSATLAVLWQGLSLTFGITIGQASLIVAAVMILFAFFYDRKQIFVGTILYQIIYSPCMDLFVPLLRYSNNAAVNFAVMVLGIVIFSVGTAVYSFADWGRGAYEAVMFSFVDKNGFQPKWVKMILDAVMVILGMILGGKFGWCTVVTVLISGFIIQWTLKLLRKFQS